MVTSSQLWKGEQNFLRHIFILANKKNKQIKYTSLVLHAQFFHSPSAFFSDDVAFQIYTLLKIIYYSNLILCNGGVLESYTNLTISISYSMFQDMKKQRGVEITSVDIEINKENQTKNQGRTGLVIKDGFQNKDLRLWNSEPYNSKN